MITVLLYGCSGHMGRVVADMIAQTPDMEIAAGIDAVDPGNLPFPVFTDAASCTVPADVIIDFSTAAAVGTLLTYGVERNIPIVLCTTGLSDEQIASVKEASEKIAILRSANMSLGINLFLKLLREAAGLLVPAGYDPEIMEMHHRRKLDAPSGTAIMLADSVNEGAGGGLEYVYDRHEKREKRGDREIGLSAMRGGTVVGTHSVVFAGEDEVIEFRHTAYSRAIFAKGAVQAARFLPGKAPGIYTMSDVIG